MYKSHKLNRYKKSKHHTGKRKDKVLYTNV